MAWLREGQNSALLDAGMETPARHLELDRASDFTWRTGYVGDVC